MRRHRRHPVHAVQALLALTALLAGLAFASAPPPPYGVPDARLRGEGTFTWWGFQVYDARLWTAPEFDAGALHRHPFVLELTYHRALRGADIARTSLQAMRRAGPLDEAVAQRWQQELARLFPDVGPGDRLAGVHRPGGGVAFFANGRLRGEVADPAFALPFFGIWLAPTTLEPALRAALLGQAR